MNDLKFEHAYKYCEPPDDIFIINVNWLCKFENKKG